MSEIKTVATRVGFGTALKELGHEFGGFIAHTTSDIFKGAGVSSSAAFEVLVCENSVTVKKADLQTPKTPIDSHNDHRIVMALSVLLSVFGGEICEAEAVRKSYPGFFSDIASLGIEVTLYD